MAKTITVRCDVCSASFDLSLRNIRNRQSGDLEFRYILCPHCGAAFLSTTTDTLFRKLMKKKKLTLKLKAAMSEDLNRRYFCRFRELVPTAFDIYTKKGDADNEAQ